MKLQTCFFNQEKIVPDIVPNPDDGTVDINMAVEEKSSDQLELSAGFGGGIGVTGTLGVSFNNFSSNNFFRKGGMGSVASWRRTKIKFACTK